MKKQENNETAVKIVDALLQAAITHTASDIHLEPTDIELRVRLRIDGFLSDQIPINKVHMPQVISRLKILGRMNIAEKRVPQDGKFTLKTQNNLIDFRISTFPSLFGEKIVVRILDRASHTLTLDQLGFSITMLQAFLELIQKPTGLLLVTGPTGSGKTTTLYGALSHLHAPERNIITLEDPVEYHIEGITQGQINSDSGFTFEKGIRSLLRQDPDVLMVGEIRDKQTARIAIEAAMTGHLVLSTLHTNDAPSAVMRLMDMGIEPYLINASLLGVLAQRLVRKICNACKQSQSLTPALNDACAQMIIPETALRTGVGCNRCNNLGFKGRVGVFELLRISSSLRSLIVSHPNVDALYEQALNDGMQTLTFDGAQKVKEGIIALDELLRVIH